VRNNAFVKKIVYFFLLSVSEIRDHFFLKKDKWTVSVLCYHRINDTNHDDMTVSTDAFEHQLRLLKKHYHLISASELEQWIRDPPSSCSNGKKAVLITFDDGYEDNFRNALPILKKYSCPAIFFVPTSYVSSEKSFSWDMKEYPEQVFLKITWEQLQEASKNDIEIGTHGDAHINYGSADLQVVKDDIETSIKKYRRYFKSNPIFMAYPYGGQEDIAKEVKDYIREHKEISLLFSAYGGKNICPLDRYDIKRIFISTRDRGIIFLYRIK